jgi:hypothetical protein
VDRDRALLLECLLAVTGPSPTLRALVSAATPERVVRLARRWAVAETAAYALMRAGVLEGLGGHAAGALRGDLENASARNALLLAEAALLQRALRAEGIDSVALKGVALVAAHYPGVGARHVGDLDLLVHPDAAPAAAAVLRGRGCAALWPPLPDLAGRPASGVRADRHHLPALRTPGGNVCELHYAAPGAEGGETAAATLLARARTVSFGAGELRIPALDDLLGMACAHALSHHRGDARLVPRHVVDVAVLLAAGADVARTEQRWSGGEVAASLAVLAAAQAGQASAVFPAGGAWPPWARARVLAAALRKEAVRGQLSRVLFPAPAYLSRRYAVAPGSPVVPLLWAWRPLRALLRVVSGR